MKSFLARRRVLSAAVLILLVLFVVRPGASRLKSRITNAISRAVARPADIGSVHIRFLPRPGFDLDNLVIYEDPAFGAEPMLRASEVTAVVRLTSLLRGRLDIARLELTEPSLNLVHLQDGRWNLNSLLEHTAGTPLAPTAKLRSESRPGFPYIEATSGRINFKNGAEKTPFALLNADFSLWQESENSWGVRLRAEPVRTDMNLSDTGLLRVNGTWQRADSLRETPLQLNLEWQGGQLGQLTKLALGSDKGWRGDVKLGATLSGRPAALEVSTDLSLRGFHRYDIPASESLDLAAHCDAKHIAAEAMLREIACAGPVESGMITLRGDARPAAPRLLDLVVNLDSVPASAVAQLVRRMKKNLPEDLVANGRVQADLRVTEDAKATAGAVFQGHGEIINLRLLSPANKTELAPASIPFVVKSASTQRAMSRVSRRTSSAAPTDAAGLTAPNELRLEYGPFTVGLGGPLPAQVRGWMAWSGYGMSLQGDGEIARILRVASLLGLQTVKANAEGSAQLDLHIAGSWAGTAAENPGRFFSPRVIGTAQLHNVRASIAGLNGPIEISSVKMRLADDKVRADDLSATAGGAHWTGWMELPRGCGTPGACSLRFYLDAEEVSWNDLQAWLNLSSSPRRWYQLLPPQQSEGPSLLQKLQATGDLKVSRFKDHDIVAEQVSASLQIDRGKVQVNDIRADLLGGNYRGEWRADFTAAAPAYSGSGTLTKISFEQIAEAMHDPWIAGTVTGTYQLKASAANAAAFWQSAQGAIRFDVRDGSLPHISLNSGEPFQITRWQGRAELHDGKIEIATGDIVSPAGTFTISGTATFSRVLDLKLSSEATADTGPVLYSITGTLAAPQIAVTPHPETQARLKP